MKYLILFLVGLLLIKALVSAILRAGASLAVRIFLILFTLGVAGETFAVPFAAYHNVIEKAKVEEAIKSGASKAKVYLDGKKINPDDIDLSKYGFSYDAETGEINLREKKFTLSGVSDEMSKAFSSLIMSKPSDEDEGGKEE